MPRQNTIARRQQVSRACARCAYRKIKCDGVRPACGTCEKAGVECIYSERRREQQERNLEDAQHKITMYEQTLLTLRGHTSAPGGQLIQRALHRELNSPDAESSGVQIPSEQTPQQRLERSFGLFGNADVALSPTNTYGPGSSYPDNEMSESPFRPSSETPGTLPYIDGVESAVRPGIVQDGDLVTKDNSPLKEPYYTSWNGRISFAATQSSHSSVTSQDFDIHIILTAVSKGWEYTRGKFQLDAQWIALEISDVDLMRSKGPVERAAYLWIMRAQLAMHDNIPAFMAPCEAQLSNYVYDSIVNICIWVRIRELFIYRPAEYCTDTFMKALVDCARFRWPFSWQDAVVENRSKGMLEFSDELRARLQNVTCYAIEQDLLDEFPDLVGATSIPTFSPRPSPGPSPGGSMLSIRHASLSPSSTSTSLPTGSGAPFESAFGLPRRRTQDAQVANITELQEEGQTREQQPRQYKQAAYSQPPIAGMPQQEGMQPEVDGERSDTPDGVYFPATQDSRWDLDHLDRGSHSRRP